jgi:hypothetical protein
MPVRASPLPGNPQQHLAFHSVIHSELRALSKNVWFHLE